MAEGMDRSQAAQASKQMVGQDDRGEILLPHIELPLIRLALAIQHRWQRAPAGLVASVPTALDLNAADIAARWLGIAPDAWLMNGLTILEREALKLMRAKQ